MKRILIFQIVTIIFGSLIMVVFGRLEIVPSFVVGGLLVSGNFITLGTLIKLIFKKKLIALVVLVIVFKYAILGIIIYLLLKQSWLFPFWFAAGVSSMMVGSLIYAVTLRKTEE